MKNKINRYYKIKLYFIKLSCNTLLGLLFSLKLSATTFTVTNTSDNNFTPPYTPNTLRWAIYNAEIDANAGNYAIISFNANGLCQIQDYLGWINIWAGQGLGSISFEKALGSSGPQGWEVIGTVTSPFGLLVIDNPLNTSVHFSNLNIVCNTSVMSPNNKTNIELNYANNISFDHCNFYNHAIAIGVLYSRQGLSITNCNFSSPQPQGFGLGSGAPDDFDNITISNNTCINTSFSCIPGGHTTIPYTINFSNNAFVNGSALIILDNDDIASVSYNSFNGGGLEISRGGNSSTSSENASCFNNQFSNATGSALTFGGPLDFWVCKNNTFNNNSTDIRISSQTYSSIPTTRICGLNLIEPSNSLGYTPQNFGNVFISHTGTAPSIIVTHYSSEKLFTKIIGLVLKGHIECNSYSGTTNTGSSIIRQNKIVSNHWVDVPINLTGNANAGNEKPTITLAQLGGTSLTINYNLTNLNTAGQPNFVVDFYKSNANGDLVSYLGNSGNLSYTTINGPHTSTLSVSGLSITDRIAATVTSYPNVLPLVDFGTSHASYPNSLTPAPIICDYNDPCSPINISCYDNNLNIQLPNCPLLNVWYIFNPNGDAACEATINFNSQINKFNLVSQWINLNQNQPCSTLGSPFFTTTSGLGLNYNFTTNQISAGNNIIQIQLAGVPVPGQPNLYSYNLLADGYSRCSNCPQPPCETCIGSFAPEPTVDPLKPSEYIVSAWARKDGASSTITNFTDPRIKIFFNVGSPVFVNTSGPVIDGWQKLYAKFLIPIGANKINVELDCVSGNCLFDDVRIFPAKGMMKSYVYDPKSMRFVAELDEENYASFFEYDEEGKLTTVKKETVRGIMTIKESRSKIVKQ